jgi:hypothetical protein
MPIAILFWVIYLLAVIFGYWSTYTPGTPFNRPFIGVFALWVLVGILGWQVFGPAIR